MAEYAGVVPQVLVTGASGFIATHIIQQLLRAGQTKVRGTVRSLSNEAKVKPLQELLPNATYPLELVEADLLNEISWREAVRDCTYVYHVASPLPPEVPSDENELIKPAVDGTLNVLKACAESGTVKRVVLTSSLGAVSAGLYGNSGKYSESDWSDETKCPPYEKSKLKAELSAWEFVENLEEGKRFELVTMNPSVVIGPPLTMSNGQSTSLMTVKKILAHEIPVLFRLNLAIVDVRDVAMAHIVAMETPNASGQRFILTGGNLWLREISDVILEEFGSQGYKVPSVVVPKPGVWLLSLFNSTVRMVYPSVGNVIEYDNTRMRTVLGIEPRDMNTTIIDACYGLIEMGIVSKTRGYHGPTTDQQTTE